MSDSTGSIYYQDDFVTLYLGDCLTQTAWLDADVLCTDPPYGIGYSRGKWMRAKAPNEGFAGIANDTDTSVRDGVLALWGSKPALVFGSPRVPEPEGVRWTLVFEKPIFGCSLFGQRGP